MKIGVMSDLHLGNRQYGLFEREYDFYNQLQKCVDELNQHHCDIVIIAGDIFDKPNPSPEAIHHYLDKIANLKTDVIITIKGNHTMLLRDNHYSVDKLVADDSTIIGYTLLDDERWSSFEFALGTPYDSDFCKWKDEKINIDGITYRNDIDIDEFIEVQKKMASQLYNDDSINILVVHQAFSEFCGFVNDVLSIKDIDLTPYDFIICGHIHARANISLPDDKMFIQPGSIERLNIDEAHDEIDNGKGIYILDTNTKQWDFYPIECDRKFIFGTFDAEGEEVELLQQTIQSQIDECEIKPVLALDYIDPNLLWKTGKNYTNYLINNSRTKKMRVKSKTPIITEDEIPPVKDAVQQVAQQSLPEDEANLAVELFDVLTNDTENASDLLDNYFKNHFNNKIKEEESIISPEIEELYSYFENLEVKK